MVIWNFNPLPRFVEKEPGRVLCSASLWFAVLCSALVHSALFCPACPCSALLGLALLCPAVCSALLCSALYSALVCVAVLCFARRATPLALLCALRWLCVESALAGFAFVVLLCFTLLHLLCFALLRLHLLSIALHCVALVYSAFALLSVPFSFALLRSAVLITTAQNSTCSSYKTRQMVCTMPPPPGGGQRKQGCGANARHEIHQRAKERRAEPTVSALVLLQQSTRH